MIKKNKKGQFTSESLRGNQFGRKNKGCIPWNKGKKLSKK
jgi:hypothetical protein